VFVSYLGAHGCEYEDDDLLGYKRRVVSLKYIQGVQKVTQPMAYLESVFPVLLISKRLWPPRSPDLRPPDFFLWGHLKDTMYSNHPHIHTARASGQHSAHYGQDINWHIAKRVR
jgi:hypothetical protein